MEEWTLSTESPPRPEDVATLARGLTEHALPTTKVPGFQELAVFARDAGSRIVGGVFGTVNWNWLQVSLMWIDPGLRGQGLGSRLLRALEEEARQRGARNVHVDTFSFQARGFYERHGYTVFATLDGYPPGHQRHYLKKSF